MFDILHFPFLRLVDRHRLLKNRCRLPDRRHQRRIVPDTAAKKKAASLIQTEDRMSLKLPLSALEKLRVRLWKLLSISKTSSRITRASRSRVKSNESLSRESIQPTCNNNQLSPWMPIDSGSSSTAPPSRANWSATPRDTSSSPRTCSSLRVSVFTPHECSYKNITVTDTPRSCYSFTIGREKPESGHDRDLAVTLFWSASEKWTLNYVANVHERVGNVHNFMVLFRAMSVIA